MQQVEYHLQKTAEMQSTVHVTVVSLGLHSVSDASCHSGPGMNQVSVPTPPVSRIAWN